MKTVERGEAKKEKGREEQKRTPLRRYVRTWSTVEYCGVGRSVSQSVEGRVWLQGCMHITSHHIPRENGGAEDRAETRAEARAETGSIDESRDECRGGMERNAGNKATSEQRQPWSL